VRLLCVQVVASGTAAEVGVRVVGVRFVCGAPVSALPGAPEDGLLVPPPYELRILARPGPRKIKAPSGRFRLLTATADTYLESEERRAERLAAVVRHRLMGKARVWLPRRACCCCSVTAMRRLHAQCCTCT
jgi:hypothetical protein